MGLDTTHDCWHGPYSAFTRWRHVVARAAGYEVLPVKYEDGTTMDTIMVDWGHITAANLQGEWDETPKDALMVLIAHSDCDGLIHPNQGRALADRLEGLLPLLQGGGRDGGSARADYDGTRAATERFIAGLRAAAEAGEDVRFH